MCKQGKTLETTIGNMLVEDKLFFLVRFACPFLGGITDYYQPDFHETWWKGVVWAKEEPTTGPESRGRSTNLVSLSLTLRDRAFGLGRGLYTIQVPF